MGSIMKNKIHTIEVENNETEIVEEVEPSVDFYAKALKRHNSK